MTGTARPNPTTPTPSPHLERFGARIRTAREALDLSLSELASRCRLKSEELAAYEKGKEEPERSIMAELDKHLAARGVLLDAWARIHITGLAERGADVDEARWQAHRITVYAPLAVPGIFQDSAYTRAVQRCAPHGNATRSYTTTVQTNRTDPPYYCLLLDETALRRRIGGPEAMRAQLTKLLAYAESDPVALHVIPARAARHPGLNGGLWTLTYSAHHTIAYQPAADGGPGQLVTDAHTIACCTDAVAALQLAALPAEETTQLIRDALAALDSPAAPKAITTGDPAAPPTLNGALIPLGTHAPRPRR